ncbi:MAG: HPr family phosphocarrier protein [Candidatus Onthomonas sp.]
MKSVTYTIHEKEGLHARPAGQLVNAVKPFTSVVTLAKGSKGVDAKKIFKVMSLAVKCGETVTITAEGPDEDAVMAAVEEIMGKL